MKMEIIFILCAKKIQFCGWLILFHQPPTYRSYRTLTLCRYWVGMIPH